MVLLALRIVLVVLAIYMVVNGIITYMSFPLTWYDTAFLAVLVLLPITAFASTLSFSREHRR